MSDHAATALSLTPIPRHWQEVASMLFAYLKREHEPHPVPPVDASLLVVDARSRRVVQAPTTRLVERLEPEPAGTEYWRAFDAELWFGGHACFIVARLRDVGAGQTALELWLPSRAQDAVFGFDPDGREFSRAAKSDLVRLMIGVAKTFGCSGFAFRLSAGDRVWGPPAEDLLRDYVEVGNRWLGHADPLIVAALDAQRVDGARFEFDEDAHPMHYRQGGYCLYDILWPRA